MVKSNRSSGRELQGHGGEEALKSAVTSRGRIALSKQQQLNSQKAYLKHPRLPITRATTTSIHCGSLDCVYVSIQTTSTTKIVGLGSCRHYYNNSPSVELRVTIDIQYTRYNYCNYLDSTDNKSAPTVYATV